MLIVNDDRLHRLEGDVDDVFYFFEALVRGLFATSLLQIEAQIFNWLWMTNQLKQFGVLGADTEQCV